LGPEFPLHPDGVYKRQKTWPGWSEYLSSSRVSNHDKEFLKYEEAKRKVKKLKISSEPAYRKAKKQSAKMNDLPSSPMKVYAKTGWVDWYSFFDKPRPTDPVSFMEARDIIRKMKIASISEYKSLQRAGMLPAGLTSNPNKTYREKGWISWPHFFGKD
jgi:hypothetical protein